MDWKDIGITLAEIGLPLLGAALPIPGGEKLGRHLAAFVTGNQDATPKETFLALADPEGQEKARQFWAENQSNILRMQLDAETARIQAVNQTMQAEAAAQHWPTFTWRPFLGFVAGVMIFGDYFLLPLMGIDSPYIPSEAWMFLSAVLGIASWGHSSALKDPSNTAITKG